MEEQKTVPTDTQAISQLSNAINLRRLAIMAVVAVVVFLGTALLPLIYVGFDLSSSAYQGLLKIWVVAAALMIIVGLLTVVSSKRPTKPS